MIDDIILIQYMVYGQIKHAKGGGVHYSANFTSPESRLFKAGLRQDPKYVTQLVHGRLSKPSDFHDKLDYERGAVIHSRSSANQFFNFHYMYGGFYKYVVQRWWKQHFYRKFWRVAWFPMLFAYGLGCYGMRKYDNAAYKYFYFSD